MGEKKICIAGSGGQGVLLLSKILATAGMLDKKNVTLIPSYGAEMRGGVITCTVIISDEDIGSPIVKIPDIVIAMNNYAMQKYGSTIADGGLLLANQSLIDDCKLFGKKIKTVFLPATELAKTSSGLTRLTNMIMMGAFFQKTKLVPLKKIEESITLLLPSQNQDLISLNLKAFHEGIEYLKKEVIYDYST